MANGPRGAVTVDAASATVGEVPSTESESATTQHQQTVGEIAKDLTDKHEPVTPALAVVGWRLFLIIIYLPYSFI